MSSFCEESFCELFPRQYSENPALPCFMLFVDQAGFNRKEIINYHIIIRTCLIRICLIPKHVSRREVDFEYFLRSSLARKPGHVGAIHVILV